MSSDEKNNTNQAKAVKLKGLWNNIYKNVFKREKGQGEFYQKHESSKDTGKVLQYCFISEFFSK